MSVAESRDQNLLRHQCDVVVDGVAVQQKGFPVALDDVILSQNTGQYHVISPQIHYLSTFLMGNKIFIYLFIHSFVHSFII